MITPGQLARAEYIIDQSQMVTFFEAARRTSNRGRRPKLDATRLLLLGLFLAVHTRRTATLADAYEILTQDLDLDDQIRLGIRDEDQTVVLRIEQFWRVSTTFADAAASYDPDAMDRPSITHPVLVAMGQAVVDLFNLGFTATTFALDETAMKAWGRGRRSDDDGRSSADNADQDDDTEESEDLDLDLDPVNRWDPDAAWGHKTPTPSDRSNRYYGFGLHALVQVCDADRPTKQANPPIVVAFGVTPAGKDVVGVSLGILDRCNRDVKDLLIDRNYNYKKVERWADALQPRGIRQHFDLHPYDYGFDLDTDERLMWAAGRAHCPATPVHLGTIPRPGPNAPAHDHATFRKQIDQRQAYALQIVNRPDDDGDMRVRCPALNGTVGCPLRPGTVATAVEENLPIIPKRDAPKNPPRCCTNQTITITLDNDKRKQYQHEYWGSQRWERMFKRRTYVEGLFGNLKNPSGESMTRGQTRCRGHQWHFVIAMLNIASYNLRILRKWHDETGLGDPAHPLLRPDPPFNGFRYATAPTATRHDHAVAA